jgi:hypothetical protein
MIVARFIGLLNAAVTTALEQMPVEAFSGATAPTVGGVKGEVAPPVLLSESPHPAVTTASRNAEIQILLTFNVRISFSSSPSYKAFNTASTRVQKYGIPSLTGCLANKTVHQRRTHIPPPELCRLCNIEQELRKAIKTADCPLLDSFGRNLLGKVERAVERLCRDGDST